MGWGMWKYDVDRIDWRFVLEKVEGESLVLVGKKKLLEVGSGCEGEWMWWKGNIVYEK